MGRLRGLYVEIFSEVDLVRPVEGFVHLWHQDAPLVVFDGSCHDVAVAGAGQPLEHLREWCHNIYYCNE